MVGEEGGVGAGRSRDLGPAGGKQSEIERKGAGGRDEANRLSSPPPGRAHARLPGSFTPTRPPPRLQHIHSLLVPSPGPLSSEVRSGDWGLQKLPRGVLAAAPRACVASPPAPASPAPFSTQILPAGSSSSPPLAGGSAHSPRCSSLLLLQPRSLLPLLSPSFCSPPPPLESPPGQGRLLEDCPKR